jgi:hypothetical protein
VAPVSIYAETVMADAPTSFWRMDEPSGTGLIDMQSFKPGSYIGGFTLGQVGPIAPDTAVLLNGTTGYATVTTFPSQVVDTTSYIQRSGTGLTLAGRPFRFLGLNIYNCNSDGGATRGCSYDLQSGTLLDDTLVAAGYLKVLRCWFFQRFASNAGVRDWTYLDKTISTAKARGFRVIAVLGNQWGDCESAPANVYHTRSWYATRYKTDLEPIQTYYAWIQAVATRYASEPGIAWWELLNEPEDADTLGGVCNAAAPATLKAWADDCASVVKVADANHMVGLGTLAGQQCGSSGADYQNLFSGANIDLLAYHDYGNPSTALPAQLSSCLGAARALNKPLFVGEIGITAADPGGGTTLAGRSKLFAAKFVAQLGAGTVGAVPWVWRSGPQGGSSLTDYNIGPTDPVLDVVRGFGSRAFTLELWAKSTTATWGNNGFLLSSRDVNGFIVHPNSTFKTVSFYVLDSAGTAQIVGTVTPADITIWHHYVATWDGITGQMYLDGQSLASGTPAAPRTATTLTIDFGRDFGNRFLSGNLAAIAIYPNALSAERVAAHYSAAFATRGTGRSSRTIRAR